MVESSEWREAQRALTEPSSEPLEDWALEGRPAKANALPVLVHREDERRYQAHLITCRVVLLGLKQGDLLKVSEVLRDCTPQLSLAISEAPLFKSHLRGYEYRGSADLAVLHHRAEGRLLLTDRNGYYQDLLGSLYRACGSL